MRAWLAATLPAGVCFRILLGYYQKWGIMLARLLEDPVLLFLCGKVLSNAAFEVVKVA